MYAIVEIAGQQFKVEKDQQIYVNRLDAKEGSSINFDKVLLIDNAGKVSVGSPLVNEANVSAKIIKHLKGDKVIVFKKKRRKGYKVKNGHRSHLTKVEITSIEEKKSVAKKPAAKKPVAKKPVAKKPVAKKPVAKKPVAKKPVAKKPVAKKPVAKKTAAKKTEK